MSNLFFETFNPPSQILDTAFSDSPTGCEIGFKSENVRKIVSTSLIFGYILIKNKYLRAKIESFYSLNF